MLFSPVSPSMFASSTCFQQPLSQASGCFLSEHLHTVLSCAHPSLPLSSDLLSLA